MTKKVMTKKVWRGTMWAIPWMEAADRPSNIIRCGAWALFSIRVNAGAAGRLHCIEPIKVTATIEPQPEQPKKGKPQC